MPIHRIPRHRRRLSLRALREGCCGLALCTGGLLACSGDDQPPPLSDTGTPRPVPGCEQFSYRSCSIVAADCQSELFRLVGCLRGEDLKEAGPPPVSLLSEEQATALLQDQAAAAEETMPDVDFAPTVRALELLGLIDPGVISSPSDVLGATIQEVAAFYQPSTREVVVIDRGNSVKDLDANATLAHEFVHAWQDRRHDLGSFAGDEQTDSDLALALTSVVEGEAMLYQLQVMLAYRGTDLERVDYSQIFGNLLQQADQLGGDGSPMLSAASIFPYTYGARYMGERWLDGGQAKLDRAYDQPPASSLEVMWERSTPMPSIQTFDAMPAPLEGYRFVTDDVAGAWVLFGHLLDVSSSSSSASALHDLSASWRGDRFWVYQSQDADAATAVIWWIDWADTASAARFAQLDVGQGPALLRIDTAGSRSRIVVSERAADLDAWAQLSAR